MTDVLGRSWQMGTIQLDYQMPVQFGLTYMGPTTASTAPVVIHRALLGSLERFIGHPHRALRGRLPLLARAGAGAHPAGRRGAPGGGAGPRRAARGEGFRVGRRRARRDAREAHPRRRAREGRRSSSSTATASPTRRSPCASGAEASRPFRSPSSSRRSATSPPSGPSAPLSLPDPIGCRRACYDRRSASRSGQLPHLPGMTRGGSTEPVRVRGEETSRCLQRFCRLQGGS